MSQSNATQSELLVYDEVTRENCVLAEKLNRSSWLIAVAFTHVLVAVLGLLMMYEYFKKQAMRKAVGLIISAVGFVYYFWGFTTSIIVYFYKLYLYFRQPEACDYIWRAEYCYVFYSQHGSACGLGFTSFHIALFGERIYSLCFEAARERTPIFGGAVGLFVLVFPQYWTLVHYLQLYRRNNLLFDRVFCSSPIHTTGAVNTAVLQLFISLVIIDIAVTIGDLCLLFYNKRKLAKYYQRISTTYTLTKSFSLREAQISIRLICPFSLSHSVSYSTVSLCYIFYLLQASTLSSEVDQFWREAVNLMRTFNNLLLFSVLCFVHRQKRTSPSEWTRNENEAERYFQQFNQMIS